MDTKYKDVELSIILKQLSKIGIEKVKAYASGVADTEEVLSTKKTA